ncbi:MAG: patatin-like phospholipase family protein [Planctomycetota bacterium]
MPQPIDSSEDTAAAETSAVPSILSIDGGGMLGIMTTVYLDRLEQRLDCALRDCFDVIAGTSTGAILAAAIAMGKPVADIRALYRDRGRAIFAKSAIDDLRRTLTSGISKPEYSDAGLEAELKRELAVDGSPVRFGDLPGLVILTAYETIRRDAWVFKSDRSALRDIPVWELVKASSSAPTYFPAHGIDIDGAIRSFIDGGVFANNPCALALAEVLARGGGSVDPRSCVVASFGNGEHTRPIGLSQAREWGAAEWARPIIGVMMDGDQDTTAYICRSVVGNDRFFRFVTPLERGSDDMDDASPGNLERLVAEAEGYIEQPAQQRELDRLAAMLIESRST